MAVHLAQKVPEIPLELAVEGVQLLVLHMQLLYVPGPPAGKDADTC